MSRMLMRLIEHQFSDLLRRPKEVTGDVEDGDVLLRRRDEPDLRLSRADRQAERADAFAALARTFRNLADHNRPALEQALADAFPWIEFLPRRDRAMFLHEFARVVSAAADLDNYSPLVQLLREWRATAEIHADPKLARRLRSPITAAGGPVPAPTE